MLCINLTWPLSCQQYLTVLTILLIFNCHRHIIFATFPQLKSKITFLLSLKANDWYCCFIGTKNDVTLEYEQLCVVLHRPLNLNPEQSFTSASWHAEVLLHSAMAALISWPLHYVDCGFFGLLLTMVTFSISVVCILWIFFCHFWYFNNHFWPSWISNIFRSDRISSFYIVNCKLVTNQTLKLSYY